jgi:hypothetical protein
MPKISTYNTVTPQGTDKIIISQENGTPTNVTKNITVDGLKEYLGTSGIPTPYMYVLKTPGAGASVAIQKPVETDWLTKNPRLFMFRYTKAKPKYINNQDYVMGRGNFVHPSHNNGAYQRANFPGSNWASTQQDARYNANIDIAPLFPIKTEWDINSELKIAKTGSLITDFASLRPTTYIEVPFNPLAFLFDGTNTEVTSLPATSSSGYWGTRFSVQNPRSNVNPLNNPNGKRTTQIIMKFAIGIPNPTWTNTNHELPYIFGDLSNAVMLKYRYNVNDRTICTSYSITQGATGPSARSGT